MLPSVGLKEIVSWDTYICVLLVLLNEVQKYGENTKYTNTMVIVFEKRTVTTTLSISLIEENYIKAH